MDMFTTNSGRFISYYGREHTLDIQRQDRNNSTIGTIDQLFNVLLNVWCKETAYPSCQKDYDYDNDPTYGQCAITATLVYNLFGGTIHKLKVDGGGTHYFNKINDHYEEFIGNRQYKNRMLNSIIDAFFHYTASQSWCKCYRSVTG